MLKVYNIKQIVVLITYMTFTKGRRVSDEKAKNIGSAAG